MLTVLPDRFVKAWDGQTAPEQLGCTVDPIRALNHDYDTDAHAVAYHLVDEHGEVVTNPPRLRKVSAKAIQDAGGRVLLSVLLQDIDCPEAHRTGGSAPEEWWASEGAKLVTLGPLLRGLAWYRSRGGYRLLWALPEPVGPVAYEALHARVRTALGRVGIEADPACGDWTRLYRLPRVVRDGEFQDLPMDLAGLESGVLDLCALPAAAESGSPLAVSGVSLSRYELPEVIEQNRNMELTRYAGQLRRRGLSEDEILVMLRGQVADGRCGDWRPKAGELEAIARSIGTRPSPAPTPGNGLDADGEPEFTLGSDVEVAEVLLRRLDTAHEVLADRGSLWTYAPEEGVWSSVEEHTVHQIVASFNGAPVVSGVTKDGEPKVRPLMVSMRMAKDAHTMAQSLRARPGWFDAAPPGVVLRDGLARVSGGRVVLEPVSPDHRATVRIDAPYTEARPERLHAALRQWMDEDSPDYEDKVRVFLEFVGACLAGAATRYQRAILLVGPKASNGKSTLLEIVGALFDPAHVAHVTPQALASEYSRTLLMPARVNVVAELPEADIMDAEAVKAAVTGDPMEARMPYQPPRFFRPIAGWIAGVNRLARVRDTSGGFWRRFVLIRLDRVFEGASADVNIVDYILGEKAAIVSEALRAFAALQTRGHYQLPASHAGLLHDWRLQSDPLSVWIEQEIEEDDGGVETSSGDLYQRFRVWCMQNGHKGMSSTRFGSEISERFSYRTLHGQRMYPVRTRNGVPVGAGWTPGIAAANVSKNK